MTHFARALFLIWVLALPTASSAGQEERRDYTMGTGDAAGGFSGMWRDPETGDAVTRIIAPRPKTREGKALPIFVYPQVAPQWPPAPSLRPMPLAPPSQEQPR